MVKRVVRTAAPAPKPAAAPPPAPVEPVAAPVETSEVTEEGPSLAQKIEEAMAQAVVDTQTESEAIWADDSLEESTKHARIADLNDPEALKKRMMQYREKALTEGK